MNLLSYLSNLLCIKKFWQEWKNKRAMNLLGEPILVAQAGNWFVNHDQTTLDQEFYECLN